VAVIIYADAPILSFDFTVFNTTEQVSSTISSSVLIGGSDHVAKALSLSAMLLSEPSYGFRGSDAVVVVLTNDVTQDSPEALASAITQLQSADAIVYVIGVGDQTSLFELESIASFPASHHLVSFDDFSSLVNPSTVLAYRNRLCQAEMPACDFSTQYIVMAATSTSAAQCRDLTVCQAPGFVVMPNTMTSDRVCNVSFVGSVVNRPISTFMVYSVITGSLQFSSQVILQSISLSNLHIIGGSLTVTANSVLESIKLSALTSIGSNINISDNPALTLLDVPSLRSVFGTFTLCANGDLFRIPVQVQTSWMDHVCSTAQGSQACPTSFVTCNP
jgi:hypothetical protein